MYNNRPSSGAYSAYKETSVKTASQAKLIVMLYDEAIKQIDGVIECFQKGATPTDYNFINSALNKSLDIIGELIASLDFDKGGNISQNLFSIYQFFNVEITNANIAKEVKNLADVRRLMNDLREAWNVIDANRPDPKQEAINIAG